MSGPYQRSHRTMIFVIALVAIVAGIGFRSIEQLKAAWLNKFRSQYVVFTSTRDGNYEVYSMNSDGSELSRLTNDPADDYNPSISPDGLKIAFTSRRDDNYEIYIMNFDGSDQTRITNAVGGNDFPAWSPDGKQIAFTSWRDGGDAEIYLMNADGTNQKNLTNISGYDTVPAWSPDGSQIAFVSSRDNSNMVDPISRIYIMNADGTNPRRLADSQARWPAWSPDGTKIAFISYQNGAGELHIFDLFSKTETVLVTNVDMDGKVAWSPDGQEIIFNSYIDNAHGEPYRVDIASSSVVQITSGGPYSGNADWKGVILSPTAPTSETENTATVTIVSTPTIVETIIPTDIIESTPTETLLPPTEIPTISLEPIVETTKIIDADVQQVESMLGNAIETFALGVGEVEEIPDGGEARTYPVGKFTIRVNYDQQNVAKGLQVIDGLLSEAYSLDQSGIILTRMGIDFVELPDIETPLERHWTDADGYVIMIAVDKTDGNVSTVRMYKLP